MLEDRERFIGSWRLISQDAVFPDGQRSPERGKDPVGLLIYDSLGNMAVQLARSDMTASDQPAYMDLSSIETQMHGFHAYCGTYTLDETTNIIRHRVLASGFPGYWNTVQERRYEFSAGDATLTLIASPGPASLFKRVLVWQRLTAAMK